MRHNKIRRAECMCVHNILYACRSFFNQQITYDYTFIVLFMLVIGYKKKCVSSWFIFLHTIGKADKCAEKRQRRNERNKKSGTMRTFPSRIRSDFSTQMKHIKKRGKLFHPDKDMCIHIRLSGMKKREKMNPFNNENKMNSKPWRELKMGGMTGMKLV